MLLAGHTAVYGGSFNPPHMGHQMACLYLLEALAADAVWVVPTAHHPFGKRLEAFDHRLAMSRIMVEPLGGRVLVSDIEAQPSATSRTFDTLRLLQAENPDLHFALALGSDILHETRHWHRWNEIVATVPIAVIARSGYPHDEAGPIELPSISSREVRRRLREGEPIEGLVPHRVVEYIARQRLYRSYRGENG